MICILVNSIILVLFFILLPAVGSFHSFDPKFFRDHSLHSPTSAPHTIVAWHSISFHARLPLPLPTHNQKIAFRTSIFDYIRHNIMIKQTPFVKVAYKTNNSEKPNRLCNIRMLSSIEMQY
jgi:hypothetical protein